MRKGHGNRHPAYDGGAALRIARMFQKFGFRIAQRRETDELLKSIDAEEVAEPAQ